MTPDSLGINLFQQAVWDYYHVHRRDALPWRSAELFITGTDHMDPYAILVSEVMLQQTQVGRVISKYSEFLAAFPTVTALAAAPLAAVLGLWSGLGYNRRAKFLHSAAQQVTREYANQFPDDLVMLTKLPGVGKNTAGAILAYAFNQPAVFIETNIRSIFIHHFFADEPAVSDTQLFPYVRAALPSDNAREWYWALMDYGSHLKTTAGNASRRSKTYARQSKFEGSRRQLRGRFLSLLIGGEAPRADLLAQIDDERALSVLNDLIKEGLITENSKGNLSLPS